MAKPFSYSEIAILLSHDAQRKILCPTRKEALDSAKEAQSLSRNDIGAHFEVHTILVHC